MTTLSLHHATQDATLSDEHAACSYRQPVLVYRGTAYGAADSLPGDDIFAGEHAAEIVRRRGLIQMTDAQAAMCTAFLRLVA